MAIVHRSSLFAWQSVESRSDLDRLRLVIAPRIQAPWLRHLLETEGDRAS